ncbi:hypothetical protein [Polyangium spumosum]|uniref:Uncharacterized protein n=1 Tax=Polyangium spumosum TaxID=889282 RepID=A0A6N7PLV4_9BACT|nr:hypothetical protein [Polyangium spumosum]MRG93053.1 hypothetical protein [Polyangium spumosum]
MRRDLTRGCSSCRLRFSSALKSCPTCGRVALSVNDAIQRVEPPARAAWLAKWAIVIMVVPAIGFTLYAMVDMLVDMGPPKGAIHVVLPLAGLCGVFAGACILFGIPVGLWVGVVALLRLLLGRRLDRRESVLRVALDQAPRPSRRRRTTPGWIVELYERVRVFARKRSTWVGAAAALLLVEIVVDLFGRDPSLDYKDPVTFIRSLGILLLMNAVFLGMGLIPASLCAGFLGWALGYFLRPPSLFHFDPHPPSINEALLSRWTEAREWIVGRAEPLTEAERGALAGRGEREGEAERAELEAPFSGTWCLAFRVTGESGAQPLDDADAVPFVVVTEDGRRCVVDAANVVVNVPARGDVCREGGETFLAARGLDQGEVAAREGRIEAGDRVRVAGHLDRVVVAGVGYREHGSLEVLVAREGNPVVIEGAPG